MAKKPARAAPREAARLKINMDWQDAAGKLISTPAKSTPARKVTPRKKPTTKKSPGTKPKP